MALTLKTESDFGEMELHFGYAEFMRLRMGFLECVDALVNLGLSALYDIRFKSRHRFEVYKEEERDFWEAWKDCISHFERKTKLLREYNLEADDINIVSSFVWHSDSDGELSPEECRKLLKWLSRILETEKKREKEGENNPLWYVFDAEMFDDLKHFRTIVAFAANNNVSLKFS